MSSITFLRSENQSLEGRVILSHGNQLFRRDLTPTNDPKLLLQDLNPDAIVAAYFSPHEKLGAFIKDLTDQFPKTPVFLVAADLSQAATTAAGLSGAKDVFPVPINPDEILVRLFAIPECSDLCGCLDEEEWAATCTYLESGPGFGPDPESAGNNPEEAMMRIEADRQALELERQLLAEERAQLQSAPSGNGKASLSDDLKRELEQQASELEEQRYEFEEQKVFLMDAQREVEAVQMDWEAERANLEKENVELKQQLESLEKGAGPDQKKDSTGGWLRSTIGSLPLTKGNPGQNGMLPASEALELKQRYVIATEARRGLEGELEELSRTTAQARARQVELEEEVIDLRRRYERTGEGGAASGGSLMDRLEHLAEAHTITQSDLEAVRTRRATLILQIETLSSELSNQEITEALTPAHLQRIREVKNQRKELQDSDATLASEEDRMHDDLKRNDQELLMIESWVEELGSARTRIEELKEARRTTAENKPRVEEPLSPEPQKVEEKPKTPPDQNRPIQKKKTRGRKGGLSRRFALRGLT